MDFFDNTKNQVGYLTTRLAADAQVLQSTTSQIGFGLEALATIAASLVIAFIYGWKLAFTILCFMPVMIGAGIIQGRIFKGFSNADKKFVDQAGKICSETTANIRTVASLHAEKVFIDKYEEIITGICNSGVKRSHIRGIAHGFSQCIIFFAYAAAFTYGAYLVQIGDMQFFEVFRVFASIIFGGQQSRRATSSSQDYTKGMMAAGRLFAVIDRQPEISTETSKGKTLDHYSGAVTLTNVMFRYKSRPNVTVLKGLSFDVQPGETLALVGSSGCGKSTTIQLIERFYNTEHGTVDMDFFDNTKNQVGYLTTRLAADAQVLQSTTSQIGFGLEALATIAASLVIAFIYGWKLAFTILCFMPVMIGAGIIQGRIFKGFSNADKKFVDQAGKICSETTANIRTVASLHAEKVFIDKYEEIITGICNSGVKRFHIRGIAHGFSQCIIFFAYAAAFTYGAYLVQIGDMQFFEVFRVFASIIFGGQQSRRATSSSQDYTKGMMAAGRLFAVIDRQPEISTETSKGKTLDHYSGAVTLTKVMFRYKSRPNVTVLKGLSFDVQPGETLALVGSSGCGKSTTIQLIERFYNTEHGAVMADKSPIPSLDLKWWRSQLALVSQEPTLFDCSIAENIAYGDNSRIVSMDEIIAAARMSNIHSFIASLPLAYETDVGSKGTQLSGGQKQRFAIARALVRDPKVLLLDEATSALDSESERVVQEALDKARAGRTCIVIAHRLSTIQNADKIVVVKQGEIIEVGTHTELLALKEAYYNLVQAQNRKKKDS